MDRIARIEQVAVSVAGNQRFTEQVIAGLVAVRADIR
jgi:hypothetical protein